VLSPLRTRRIVPRGFSVSVATHVVTECSLSRSTTRRSSAITPNSSFFSLIRDRRLSSGDGHDVAIRPPVRAQRTARRQPPVWQRRRGQRRQA
jgi:hypothetical protein